MSRSQIVSAATNQHHSEKTLYRASKEIGVVKTQVHKKGKINGWMWSLPDETSDDDEEVAVIDDE